MRQFGPDVALAERLAARVAAWDVAGRPGHEGLRIRAYPRDTDLVPPERAFVVPKRWTRLVIDWQ